MLTALKQGKSIKFQFTYRSSEGERPWIWIITDEKINRIDQRADCLREAHILLSKIIAIVTNRSSSERINSKITNLTWS